MNRVGMILARLDRVKKTGPDQWLACCPAHEDNTPSMTIRALDDRILMHCFGGCAIEQILDALGITFEDLFAEPLEPKRSMRRTFSSGDVLSALAEESLVIATISGNLRRGMVLSDIDHDRLITAASRLEEGRRLALG